MILIISLFLISLGKSGNAQWLPFLNNFGPAGGQQQQPNPNGGNPQSQQQPNNFLPLNTQQTYPSLNPQQQNFIPASSQQNFVPASSQQSFIPASSQQNFVPASSQQSFIPASSQQSFIPANIIDVFKHISGGKNAFDPSNPIPGGGAGRSQQIIFPDLWNVTSRISKSDFFFDQNPAYRKAVADLKVKLLGISDPLTFAQTVGQLENAQNLNRQVWLRATIGAMVERPDISNFQIPSLLEVDTSFVLHTEVVNSVQQQAQLPQDQRQCVTVDGNVGRDNGPENALWYIREDVLVNSHHWFWHLYYPVNPHIHADRRGELFYSMHHSILARYDAERLSNGFNRVVPFVLQQGIAIEEGYRPHLTNTDAVMSWTDRPAQTLLPDGVNAAVNITLNDAIAYRTRILQSIDQGSLLLPGGGTGLSLNGFSGIDYLGDTIEATRFSQNPDYYGALGHHNTGHVFIANSVDPFGRIPPGVMAESATAMRDILFYRWHANIDHTLQTYKDKLTPYQVVGGDLQLSWPGVVVDSIQVVSRVANQQPNQLRTFWNTHQVSLSNGLDFLRDPNAGSVPLCIRHLDHEEFEYRINIRKDPSVTFRTAAVRIFLAPRLDENGQRFTFSKQRGLFFALDTFTIDLQDGVNEISRQSIDSSLTISWPQSLQELNADQNRSSVYCGCGWPHHLLLPRGTPQGMPFDLFVMVTNEVDGSIPNISATSNADNCEISYIYCGVRGKTYPDTKPMGYPFDRLPYSIADPAGGGNRLVQTLEEYDTGLTNVAVAQLQIVHQAN